MAAGSAAVDTGQGAILRLNTSRYDNDPTAPAGGVEIIEISWEGIELGVIETTHLGTIAANSGADPPEFGGKTFIAEKYADPGTLTFTCHFNPDKLPPVDGVSETLVVNWKDADGTAPTGGLIPTDGTFWKATNAICTGFGFTGVVVNSKMECTVSYKISGIATVKIDPAA